MKKLSMLSMVPIVALGMAACNNGEPELGKAQSGVESASALASETSSSATDATSTKTSPPAVMTDQGPGEASVDIDGNTLDEQFTPVVCAPEGATLKLSGGVPNANEFEVIIDAASGPDAAPTLARLEIKTNTLHVAIDEHTSGAAMVARDGAAWIIEGQGMHIGHADAELPATVKTRIVCPGDTGGMENPAP